MDSEKDLKDSEVLADDSGHYSDRYDAMHANSSQCSEHEQSLPLIMQLRKSHSEVERLSKSEQWYKQELKLQRHNRLETLERLYAQERKYMQEIQRLQQESLLLNAKCTTLERQVQVGHTGASSASVTSEKHDSTALSVLEEHKMHTHIMDQRKLIDVLRKQRKHLLLDIQRMSLEHDAKILQLQRSLAGVELENTHVIEKCKKLLDEKSALEKSLENKSITLLEVIREREQLRQVVGELNETLITQENLLAIKEQEFLDIRQHFNDKLSKESNMDAIYSCSIAFHAEINAKTNEIASLKKSLHDLQNELLVISQLEAQNEEQQHNLEHLTFALEAQKLEHENLKASDAFKDSQLEKLTLSIAAMQEEKIELCQKLQDAQSNVQRLEQELIILHKQYAEMCAICESTRFQLESQHIEYEKLMCQNVANTQEYSQMQSNLQAYVNKCAFLSDSIMPLESQLDNITEETNKLQRQLAQKTLQLANMEQKQSKLKIEKSNTCQSVISIETQVDFVDDDVTILRQRVEQLEEQLQDVKNQKYQTILLLQRLLSQQDAKIKKTNETEEDWRHLLKALQATQQLEEQMRRQLQLKTEELEELNELFAEQNKELFQLQELSYLHNRDINVELKLLKQSFHDKLKKESIDANEIRQLQNQLRILLKDLKRAAPERKNGRPLAASQYLQVLFQLVETETGRKYRCVQSWPLLANLLRKELRRAKMHHSQKNQPNLIHRSLLPELQVIVEQKPPQDNIKKVAPTHAQGDSLYSDAEPAHEMANLIDDYKNIIQQTAKETGRPRTSHIMELIDRSQRSKPTLSPLLIGITSCRSDVVQLNKLLSNMKGSSQTRHTAAPSLMEELNAVAEQVI